MDVQLPVMLVNKDGKAVYRGGANTGLPRLCEFCREFRRHEDAKKACKESEKQIGLDVIEDETSESWIGPCHMHVLGVGVPIRVAGMRLGAMLTGQLRRAENDAKFEETLASWEPKLGRARLDELRTLYYKLEVADDARVANKRDNLRDGVGRIEPIANGAFRRDRNAVERAFLVDLGLELSKTAREDTPLPALVATLGRVLGGFLDSPDYCVALYEGRGGRRLEWGSCAWQERAPAKYVSPSVVHEAASEMKCDRTDPGLLAELFSSIAPDVGVAVSRFEHQGRPFAVMFAARTAAAKLKALPMRISADFWSDMASSFRVAFSEIEYSEQLRGQVEKVQDKERALRAYFEGAVHNLKMPLSAIILHTEEALQGPVPPRLSDNLQRISDFSGELATKIQSLIRGAAEEVGEPQKRATQQKVKVKVKETVLRVIDRYRHNRRKRKHQKGIDFKSEVEPVMFGDPLELETIFDNLVDNAVKYTYPGKEVRVELDADETELQFEIENYGPGILPEEKEKVWERYYRGVHDDDWSGAVAGSGIGLFVVKQTVLSYGGRVWFESRPSAGEYHDREERASGRAYVTRFFLTLPLHRT